MSGDGDELPSTQLDDASFERSPQPEGGRLASSGKKRTRSGCLGCRKRRRKCDEGKPACDACQVRNEVCQWGMKVSFRPENAQTVDSEHPSMKISASQGRPQAFQIVDVTSEITREYIEDASFFDQDIEPLISEPHLLNGHLTSPVVSHHDLRPSSSGLLPLPSESATPGVPTFSSPHFSDSTLEDGIFLPGSEYQELFTTLRSRIIDTARSTAPTPQRSPIQTPALLPEAVELGTGEFDDGHVLPKLSPEEEYDLLQNYIYEVAPWVDKFDNKRHFESVLPILAKAHPHLKYAILAVSARQIERKKHMRDYSRSLALYSTSIRLLTPLLGERSTVVLASCMCLCVLEMLSCSPKAWRRHLDGCAALITCMEITGICGGLEQALFWCFARMDMIGGWISAEKTLIPMSAWVGGPDVAADAVVLQSTGEFDGYANLAVYLCGQAVELLCHSGRWEHHQSPSTVSPREYAKQWLRLFSVIEAWYNDRPDEMKSILTIPSSQDASKPFPTVLYANPPAISGNQMYHTAALLMLKHKPAALHLEKRPRSMLWHAKRICAISISNHHHGCWTNSTNPIWLAGQFMSHPCEHKAILDVYERIESESGWATKWRADDLRAYWGMFDD